jgi:hypothetical protein
LTSFREPLTDSLPREWLSDIDQAWFRGSFAMDEIVFFIDRRELRSSPT